MSPTNASDGKHCPGDSHKGAVAAADKRLSQAADIARGILRQSSPRGTRSTSLSSDGKQQHVPLLSPRPIPKTCSDETPANAVCTPRMLPVIREDEEEGSKQSSVDACYNNPGFPLLPPNGIAGSEDGEALLVAVREFAKYVHKELVQLHAQLDCANRRVGEVCAEMRLEMSSFRRKEAREREDLATAINEELERQREALQQEKRAESTSSAREAWDALSEETAIRTPARAAMPFRIADVDGANTTRPRDGASTTQPRAGSLTVPVKRGRSPTLPVGGVHDPFHRQECRDDEREAGAVAAADALIRVRRLLRSSSENGPSNVARAVQRLEADNSGALAVSTPRQRRNSLPVAPSSADVASKAEVVKPVLVAPAGHISPRTLFS